MYFVMKKIFATALAISCAVAQAQDFETAAEAVANMKVGWNLGNTLDSNSGDVNNMWIEAWTNRTPTNYETAWGQPVTTQALIAMFKEAGFNVIRVPVTWYPHMEATFSDVHWNNSTNSLTAWNPETDDIGTEIQAAWMKRVHEVVDYVIGQGMYCILNVHHDTGTASTAWMVADMDNYAAQHERFEAVWTQIANEFRDYDEHLLFEGYNEMTDVADSWCFASFGTSNAYDATIATSAYNAINSYAQSFVNAVRATGGNNSQRNLVVSTYAACSGEGSWNSHLKDPLKQMKLPTDSIEGHIAFEVHAYPSLANGLSAVKSSVSGMMNSLQNYLASKGAPVIIGEWGTADGTDYDERHDDLIAFAGDFVKKAKAKGFATIYWMGLSNGAHRSVPEFNQSDLKEAIIKGYYGEEGYTAISAPETPTPAPACYSLQGYRIAAPQRGLNIIRQGDGTVRKVVIR